jgi:hypothetical protein
MQHLHATFATSFGNKWNLYLQHAPKPTTRHGGRCGGSCESSGPRPAPHRRAPTTPLNMEGVAARGGPHRGALRVGAFGGGVDLGPQQRQQHQVMLRTI